MVILFQTLLLNLSARGCKGNCLYTYICVIYACTQLFATDRLPSLGTNQNRNVTASAAPNMFMSTVALFGLIW